MLSTAIIGRRLYSPLALSILLIVVAPAAGVRAGDDARVIMDIPVTSSAWPLSSEYAATAAATAHYGTALTQWRLRSEIGTDENPHKGFRGDVTGDRGSTAYHGVYAEPIAAVLTAHGYGGAYVFYGGADDLRAAIAAGHPVVAWVTGNWEPTTRREMRDAAGERYALIADEHAVTVYGYDRTGVWLMDPTGPEKYHLPWGTFLAAWGQFDGMALVVAT
jgi:uncharacterized protein YvpB